MVDRGSTLTIISQSLPRRHMRTNLSLAMFRNAPDVSRHMTSRFSFPPNAAIIMRASVETVDKDPSDFWYPSKVLGFIPMAHFWALMCPYHFLVRKRSDDRVFFFSSQESSLACMEVYVSILWICFNSLIVATSSQSPYSSIPFLRVY